MDGRDSAAFQAAFDQMLEDREAELHLDLVPWLEEGDWGSMLRHPLVYQVPLVSPGLANKAYEQKCEALDKAVASQDWHSVIWIHERAHRLNALIDYVTGRDEDGRILPLDVDYPISEVSQAWLDLVADVWVDSENIQQNTDEWRALMGEHNFWLGTDEERAEFDALINPVSAWRGGTVGDWSWTTDFKVAEFFARRSGIEPRHAFIDKTDCFGYLTRRGEAELLVRLTPERYSLVYPEGEPT